MTVNAPAPSRREASALPAATANAIAPALIESTAMLDGLPATGPRPSVPVGRLGRPEEVADLAVAVLSNGYLTGQVLLLDGGCTRTEVPHPHTRRNLGE